MIADVRIVNRQKFEAVTPSMRLLAERHHGRFLAVGEKPEVVQGGWHPEFMMLVEFADRAAAEAMLGSPGFAALSDRSVNHAMFDIVLADGISPSQFGGRAAAPLFAVADTRIVNRPAFEEYKAEVHKSMREQGGRYLVLSDQVTTIAGNWAPSHLTVMEFETRELGYAAHNGAQYREARDRGNNAAMFDVVALPGLAPGG
jgi:uncharacterized protein (DUF1330 family)